MPPFTGVAARCFKKISRLGNQGIGNPQGSVGCQVLNVFGDNYTARNLLDAYDLVYRMTERYRNDLVLATSSSDIRMARAGGAGVGNIFKIVFISIFQPTLGSLSQMRSCFGSTVTVATKIKVCLILGIADTMSAAVRSPRFRREAVMPS